MTLPYENSATEPQEPEAAHTPEIFTRVLMQLKDAIRYIEVENAFDGAITADKVEAKIKENKTIAQLEIGANSSHKLASFSIHDARCDVEEAEEFIAEAETVAHETGLTPRQLADELERLKRYFADSARDLVANKNKRIEELRTQRNELLNNLRNLTLAIESEIDLDDRSFLKKVVAKSRAAIAKAQQEGGIK